MLTYVSNEWFRNLSSINPKSSEYDNTSFIIAQAIKIIIKPTFLLLSKPLSPDNTPSTALNFLELSR